MATILRQWQKKWMARKMSNIIDGKLVAQEVRDEIAVEVAELKKKGIEPALAVVIVGEDPASKVYVSNKKKACEKAGIISIEYALPETTTQEELLALIDTLNNDPKVNGILVQMPLPKGLDEREVINAISPQKDVDAFHPENVGRIMIGEYSFLPCTPAGIVILLERYNVDISGKHCVIIGRSNIVGKPMSMLMLQKNATVTVCHSKTADLKGICKQADIIIAAVGRPKFVAEDMIKDGAVIIDVGINRDENNKLCGDVDFDAVKDKVSLITPVPGGVGPMTVTVLLKNTLKAAILQNT